MQQQKKLRREKKMQILSDLEEKISLFVVKFEKKIVNRELYLLY